VNELFISHCRDALSLTIYPCKSSLTRDAAEFLFAIDDPNCISGINMPTVRQLRATDSVKTRRRHAVVRRPSLPLRDSAPL
jgi:hypothetical protein